MKYLRNFVVAIVFFNGILLCGGCENRSNHITITIPDSYEFKFTGVSFVGDVSTLLKRDTSYYETYTLVCDSDSIFCFSYTALLSPNQPFKANFIPLSSFDKYCSDIVSEFRISDAIDFKSPLDTLYAEMELDGDTCYMLYYTITITSPKNGWKLLTSNNLPEKIYYHYDWQSSVHYDYMRYNADSAILTFSVENPIEADSITPIDSVYILFHDSSFAKGYNQFPLQVKDTISILDDITFDYTIGGLLKGQKCGEATHSIRVHKSEVISEQDETHRHQGETYEYDE